MLVRMISYLSLIVLIFCACYLGKSVNSEVDKDDWNNPENTLKIWLLSDIQPKNQGHKQQHQWGRVSTFNFHFLLMSNVET